MKQVTVRVESTAVMDKDAELLTRLGYNQEFRRNFMPIELFGVGFSIIRLVPSPASMLVFSIPAYGGPAAVVWGWAVCGVFLTTIAVAMTELRSAAPTSGGLYY
ncbi:hypothetical protein CPB84DRAFT_1848768 [Gymnopilus junonius]|uniref:Amino acid transporter n=1 Tax=Gymnopilus junonius TaxID=109634 RepID=A0A9P5NHK6_GYMJU|nr:hypothetical protein CPB84DRAFT_1848768 [Gymnopilus junonius]